MRVTAINKFKATSSAFGFWIEHFVQEKEFFYVEQEDKAFVQIKQTRINDQDIFIRKYLVFDKNDSYWNHNVFKS